MAGSYCRFCGHRCFVYRTVPGLRTTHWATCPKGAEYDREQTGYDYTTAHDPFDTDHARPPSDFWHTEARKYISMARKIRAQISFDMPLETILQLQAQVAGCVARARQFNRMGISQRGLADSPERVLRTQQRTEAAAYTAGYAQALRDVRETLTALETR